MKKFVYILIAGIGCCLYSCSQSLYIPASADAAQQRQLLEGRKLYVGYCSNCHTLYQPKQFNAAGWKKNLDIMQPRARVSDEQKQLIFQYLTYQQ